MDTTTRASNAHTALITASQALADLFESGDIVIDVLEHHTDASLGEVVAKVDAFLSAVNEFQEAAQ